jgi:hypothetical protein
LRGKGEIVKRPGEEEVQEMDVMFDPVISMLVIDPPQENNE